MMFQQVPGINFSFSSWYMIFQWQAIMAASESAKHACKIHTVSADNYHYLLVNNTWFGYW